MKCVCKTLGPEDREVTHAMLTVDEQLLDKIEGWVGSLIRTQADLPNIESFRIPGWVVAFGYVYVPALNNDDPVAELDDEDWQDVPMEWDHLRTLAVVNQQMVVLPDSVYWQVCEVGKDKDGWVKTQPIYRETLDALRRLVTT